MEGTNPGLDGTAIGGPAGGFPTTHWSILSNLGQRSNPQWKERMGTLASLYWKPIYAYIRRSRNLASEDAKDLTQDFFAHMIEGPMLSGLAPTGAKFRTYIKACLENFLRKVHRDAQRLKRGGGQAPIPIDLGADKDPLPLESGDATPEEILDRRWRDAIMDQAVERLRSTYANEGRPSYFEVFRRYALVDPSEPRSTYRELAQSLGVSEDDVGNFLVHARRRFRMMIREIVAESVTTREALEAELQELFGARYAG